MVKTPKTRHSKSKRDPVTIDLEPSSVSRSPEESAQAGKMAAEGTKPGESGTKAVETQATKAQSGAAGQGSAPKAASQSAKETEKPKTAENSAEAKPAEKTSSSAASEARASSFGRGTGASPGEPGKAGDTSGKPETKPQRPAPEAAPTRGGTGTAVLGGLIGAVAALVLAGALLWAGVLPVGRTSSDETAATMEDLRQEIAGVRGEVSELRDAAPSGGADGEDMAAALQRLNALEETVNSLGGDVSQLQEAVASGEAGEGAGLEALQTRLSELESAVSGLSEGSGASGANVSALQERIVTLEQDISSAAEAAQAAAEAAEANTEQMTALEEQVAALGDRVGTGGQSPTARLIAATALKSAIDSGRPFASELETFAAVAPEAQELETLRQYAEDGVPTRTELANQASDAASRMIAATRISGEDAGILQRLWASAQALVVVRPVGTPEGEDVPSTVARMEAAVESGDYETALAEYESLPQQAQAAGRDLAAGLRARLAADAVVDQSMSDALKAAQE